MSEELKEQIRQLSSYYKQHTLDKMVKTYPGFVADDFAQLLTRLEKESEL